MPCHICERVLDEMDHLFIGNCSLTNCITFQVFETPRNRAHFQVGNHLAIARDAYKGMAQSETDIKKLQGDEGRDPSSVNPSTSAPGQAPWLTCPRQPV